MKGIKFGDCHSWDDFRIILQPDWEIEAPEPKGDQIDVPGADGVIDFTEAFGKVRYKNRKGKFNFKTIVPREQFWDLFSIVQNAIHGKRLKIVNDNDPDWYYLGRITVDKWTANQVIGSMSITCDCDPYKYKRYKTVRTDTIPSSAVIVYHNSRMDVIPTIILSNPATIVFNGITFSLPSGTTISPDIVFTEGRNEFQITGNTTIRVEYQEGSL